MKIRIDPEPVPLSTTSQLVCDVCHQPIRDRKLMLVLERASKTIRLCERCSPVMDAYKILIGSKKVLCIKRAENGLLKYPQLDLAVVTCDPLKDDDYIIARKIGFQNGSIRDATALIPSIDIYLGVFRKEYKYLAGVSFKRLIDKLIKESKLHEYISTINIINKYIAHVIEHMKQNAKIHSLEVVDNRAI